MAKDLKRHKTLKLYAVLAVLIVVAVTAVSVIFARNNHDYTESVVVSSVKRSAAFDSTAVSMGTGILTYSHDGAFLTDAYGNPVWNCTYEMADPMMNICEETVAFCNRNGNTIYVYDKNGSLGQITTATPVRLLRVASTGHVLTVQDEDDVAGVYLYALDGTIVARFYTTMDQWGYPFTMDISPDGHLVMLCFVFASGDNITSRVAFYNFGSVGASSSDNFVSGFNYEDTLIPEVGFLSDSAAYAIGDNRLVFFGGKQIPEETGVITLDQNVLSVFESNETVGLLSYNGNGGKMYRFSVYDANGSVISVTEHDTLYRNYLKLQKQFLLYNESDCVIYNMKGALKYSARFENSALCMNYAGRKDYFTVVRSSNVDVIVIK